MAERISIEQAEHYAWRDACEGWHILKRDDLSVIQERVPPGKFEVKHFHRKSRQFFFDLEGQATIEVTGKAIVLNKHQGLEIPPTIPHQFRNDSKEDVVFLVISAPKSHGDRENV